MTKVQNEKENYGFDLNRVKKNDLVDFVDTLVGNRTKELRGAIIDVLLTALEPRIQVLLVRADAARIESVSAQLCTLLTPEVLDYFNMGNTWSEFDNLRSYIARMGVHFERKLRETIVFHLGLLVDNPLRMNNEEKFMKLGEDTWHIIEPLLPKVMENRKTRNDLETLKNELHTAIKNESTGKKAYMALVALNVDMSKFQPPAGSENLPAIVKLSAPVCLLNGDCE